MYAAFVGLHSTTDTGEARGGRPARGLWGYDRVPGGGRRLGVMTSVRDSESTQTLTVTDGVSSVTHSPTLSNPLGVRLETIPIFNAGGTLIPFYLRVGTVRGVRRVSTLITRFTPEVHHNPGSFHTVAPTPPPSTCLRPSRVDETFGRGVLPGPTRH